MSVLVPHPLFCRTIHDDGPIPSAEAAVFDNSARKRQRQPETKSFELAPAALQVFVFQHERFLGTQVFDGRTRLVLGRHPNADLRLPGDTVSRKHALIWMEEGQVLARDLGSSNGTWIDRRKLVGSAPFGPRTALRIGPYSIRADALCPRLKWPWALDPELAEETRLEAVLSLEPTAGTPEVPVDFRGAGPEPRLVHAARARKASFLEPVPHLVSRNASKAGTIFGRGPDPALERRVRHLDAIIARLEDRPPTRLDWNVEGAEKRLRDPSSRNYVSGLALIRPNQLPPEPSTMELQPSRLDVRTGPLMPDRSRRLDDSPTPDGFNLIEIVADRHGALLDIAVLRTPGQQYVLGHSTPQGNPAPWCCHEGLRLLRFRTASSADLVLPRGVQGLIRRGNEEVRLQDLTADRKYSCLRLVVGDFSEFVLHTEHDSIRYRLSFRVQLTPVNDPN